MESPKILQLCEVLTLQEGGVHTEGPARSQADKINTKPKQTT